MVAQEVTEMGRFYLISLVLLLFGACDKEEPVPSYVYIPDVKVEAAPDFGTSSAKVTEVWVYGPADILGVFPLPATIPVLAEGPTELTIYAGIHDNGILARPNIYPFYAPEKLTPDLVRGQVDTIDVSVGYLPADRIKLSLHADFEGFNPLTTDLDDDDRTAVVLTTEGFEGSGARLAVTDTTRRLSVGYFASVSLPANGSEVYLEMNYRNDIPFSFWLRGKTPAGDLQIEPVSVLNPHPEWNKIYIPLTQFVNSRQWVEYQPVFDVQLTDDDVASGKTTGEVVLDNLKLLSFK